MIRLEGVGKCFPLAGRPRPVLEDITLSIPAGAVFGLVGRSGAGKSTLLRMLNRLERPNTGRVLVEGLDLAGLDATGLIGLRRRVGMVFQQFNLLSAKTVAQNVALPLQVAGVPKPEIAERLAEVLARVGLEGREDSYPAQLSGGQKQRVGIARALISRPRVLLCDEATSALDPETTASVLQLLRRINADLGVTLVLVTHEMAVVREICDRVAVLAGGRLVEEAAVWQLFAAPQSVVARALLQAETPALPADLAARLSPTAFPGALRLVEIRSDGRAPACLPPGRWLAGGMQRIQGHDVGHLVMAVPPEAELPQGTEVLGYVTADI